MTSFIIRHLNSFLYHKIILEVSNSDYYTASLCSSLQKMATENRTNLTLSDYQDVEMDVLDSQFLSCDLTDSGKNTVPIQEGAYGKIYFGEYRSSPVAIKVLRDDIASQEYQVRLANWRNEIRYSKGLQGPHIVQYVGHTKIQNQEVLVMERMECTLSDYLSIHTKLNLFQKLLILKDIAAGMSWIHGKGFTHRDLKPENILIAPDGLAKIADFGLSTRETTFSHGGTPLYMPPEILRGNCNDCNYSIDVYSFGLLMWEVLTGDTAFNEYLNSKDEYDALEKGNRKVVIRRNAQGVAKHCELFRDEVIGGQRPLLKGSVTKSDGTIQPLYTMLTNDIQQLIRSCWKENAADRPNFQSILESIDALITQPLSNFPVLKSFWVLLDNSRLVRRFQIDWKSFVTNLLIELKRPEQAEDYAYIEPSSVQDPLLEVGIQILLKCLRFLLPDLNHVDIHSYLTILGPFEIANDSMTSILNRFYQTCSDRCFFGPWRDNELQTGNAPDRSTWIRFSSDRSMDLPFTFIHISNGLIKRKIAHHIESNLRYSFEDSPDKQFESLFSLIRSEYPSAKAPITTSPFTCFFSDSPAIPYKMKKSPL